jgi:hypothetical protein
MSSTYNGHVIKLVDRQAFQRRINSGSFKYKSGLKNIRGEEWAGSFDQIIAGRSNVYARDPVPHLVHFFPWQQFSNKGAQNHIGTLK